MLFFCFCHFLTTVHTSEKHDYRALTPLWSLTIQRPWRRMALSSLLPLQRTSVLLATALLGRPQSPTKNLETRSIIKHLSLSLSLTLGRDGNLGWIVSHLMVRRKPGESQSTTKGQKKPKVPVLVIGADGE